MNRRWSPEEDARLVEFHASTLSTEEIARQFEGRTVPAVQSRMKKLKLGVRTIARAKWTPEEYEILTRIWFEEGTMKVLIAKNLPHRSWRTTLEHGLSIGLRPRGAHARRHSYSWATEELDRVLAAEPNLAVSEIVARCKASRVRVTTLLSNGRGKYFRSGWRNGRKTPLWSLGPGPDVQPPAAATPTEICRRARQRKRVRMGRIDPFATLVQQVAA